jgi:hypothetical protein
MTGCGKATDNASSGAIAPGQYQPGNTTADVLAQAVLSSNDRVATLPTKDVEMLKALSNSGSTANSSSSLFSMQSHSRRGFSVQSSDGDQNQYRDYERNLRDNSGNLYLYSISREKYTTTYNESTNTTREMQHKLTTLIKLKNFKQESEDETMLSTIVHTDVNRNYRRSRVQTLVTTKKMTLSFFDNAANLLNRNTDEPLAVYVVQDAVAQIDTDYVLNRSSRSLDFNGVITLRNRLTQETSDFSLIILERRSGRLVIEETGPNSWSERIQPENGSSDFIAGKLIKDGKVVGIFEVISGSGTPQISFKVSVFDKDGRLVSPDEYLSSTR